MNRFFVIELGQCEHCKGTGKVIGGLVGDQPPCPVCIGSGRALAYTNLEEALLTLLPWVLGEIERREQLAREEADAAALLEDLERGEIEPDDEGGR